MADKDLKIKISTEADTTGAKSAEKSIQDLEKELKQLREEMKSIPVVSDAFKEAAVKVNAAEKALKDATRAAANNGNQVGALGDSYSGFGGQLRNVSYQLQDFFVQVSSGQGVMRALSQQLPQLLSGFGLFGVVMGAAASVVPLLFSAFSGGGDKVKEETEKAGTAIDDFKDKIGEIESMKANDFIKNFGKLFEDVGKYIKEANEEIDRFNKLTQAGLDSESKLAEAKAKSDKAAIDADTSLSEEQKIMQKAKIEEDLANTTERIKKEKIDADQNAKEKNNEAIQEAAVREAKNYEIARLAREEKEKLKKTQSETVRQGVRAESSLGELNKKRDSEEGLLQDYVSTSTKFRSSLTPDQYEKSGIDGKIQEAKQRLEKLDAEIIKAEREKLDGQIAAEILGKRTIPELKKTQEEESSMAKSSQAAKEAAEKSAKDIGYSRSIAETEKQTIAGESRFGREARVSETDSALNKAQKKASDEADRAADKARREQERKERDAEKERDRRAKVEADGPTIAFSAADQARGLGWRSKVAELENIGKAIALPGNGSKAGTDDELMQRMLNIVEGIVNSSSKNGKSSTDEAKKMRDLKERIDNLEKRVTRNSKMY